MALKEFQDLCLNLIATIATDNTMVVAYLSGGSKSLCAVLWRILTWCSRKQAQAQHIPTSTMHCVETQCLGFSLEGRGSTVVTHLPPTSEIGVQIPARPEDRKMVVTGHQSVSYSTELWPTVCIGFLHLSNYPSQYNLVQRYFFLQRY